MFLKLHGSQLGLLSLIAKATDSETLADLQLRCLTPGSMLFSFCGYEMDQGHLFGHCGGQGHTPLDVLNARCRRESLENAVLKGAKFVTLSSQDLSTRMDTHIFCIICK